MRLFSLIAGFIATSCAALPARGATITFSDLRQDTTLGVHVHPTGPTDVPMVTGLSEVYGSTAAFLTNSVTARYYSGFATFDKPVSKITFDVQGLNDSGWRIPITVAGLENHKRVALTTVDLAPLGNVTRVTIAAPAINEVRWTGTNWVFHPYLIRDVHISFATAGHTPTTSSSSPSGVGTPVPEPGSCALFGVIGAGMLLRRRR